MGKITVVGLGPGSFGLITMECWEIIQKAKKLYFRTEIHPTVAEIKQRDISFKSFDYMYDKAESFDELYINIVDKLLQEASNGQDIVFAVPGSPMVAERTVVLLREKANKTGVELDIKPAMSFAEIMYNKLAIDPIDGICIIDAKDFELSDDTSLGFIVTQIYDRYVASDLKLSLMDRYGDEYQVIYVHKLGMPDESIRTISLYELDRQDDIDYLTSLYVPPQRQ